MTCGAVLCWKEEEHEEGAGAGGRREEQEEGGDRSRRKLARSTHWMYIYIYIYARVYIDFFDKLRFGIVLCEEEEEEEEEGVLPALSRAP